MMLQGDARILLPLKHAGEIQESHSLAGAF
jgi:hypothetical protein